MKCVICGKRATMDSPNDLCERHWRQWSDLCERHRQQWFRDELNVPKRKKLKPKKPKPARVWSVSYGALHLNGKYKTGLMCDAADLLNAYERKIARLEGR